MSAVETLFAFIDLIHLIDYMISFDSIPDSSDLQRHNVPWITKPSCFPPGSIASPIAKSIYVIIHWCLSKIFFAVLCKISYQNLQYCGLPTSSPTNAKNSTIKTFQRWRLFYHFIGNIIYYFATPGIYVCLDSQVHWTRPRFSISDFYQNLNLIIGSIYHSFQDHTTHNPIFIRSRCFSFFFPNIKFSILMIYISACRFYHLK